MTNLQWEKERMEPRWLTARFSQRCVECKELICEGDRMVWDPKDRKAYCEFCGDEVING
jgi:hypothetical protein